MADGGVIELVGGILAPMDRLLDYIFYAGALYGARSVARLVLGACSGIRTYFIPYGRASDEDISKKYGKWAVITGGTAGIGLAYAHEFARRKMNVVLISRSYDDLVGIISELQSQYDVQTYGIYADFSLGAKVYQDVEDTLKDLEIGILVNNVSIRYDHPQYFALVPHQRVWQIVNVNISAITMMTHMLLPQMLLRKKGAIINVCSVAACTPPIPLTAEYTASMAYVDRFSQALHQENKHRGICVQTLLPCFVAQSGVKSATLFAPSPTTYVQHAMATLGVSNRACGYWPHAIQSWLCGLVPERLWVWFTRYFNARTRRRCLNEKEATGGPVFSRKLYTRRHAPAQEGATVGGDPYPKKRNGGSRSPSSDRALRRTPSPQKASKMRLDSGGAELATPSPGMQRRRNRNSLSATPDIKRKISLEEITRSRSCSTGSRAAAVTSLPPPIREDSTGFATSMPDLGQPPPSPSRGNTPPLSPRGHTPPPRRSSTVSSLEPLPRRTSLCMMRASRVMVMPSVAMVSYSQDPPPLPHNNGHTA